MPANLLSIMLCLAGAFFFLGGPLGLLRFPDALSRIHALTKADNLGLGFVVLGLMINSTLPEIIKLGLIWGLALIGSSSACYFIANYILHTSDRKVD